MKPNDRLCAAVKNNDIKGIYEAISLGATNYDVASVWAVSNPTTDSLRLWIDIESLKEMLKLEFGVKDLTELHNERYDQFLSWIYEEL